MIADQERARPLLGELDQVIDHAARVGASIHVIAHEDQAVVVAQRKGIDEFFERLPFTVNVANRVEHESD